MMKLIEHYMTMEAQPFADAGVRLTVIGRRDRLPVLHRRNPVRGILGQEVVGVHEIEFFALVAVEQRTILMKIDSIPANVGHR